MPECSPAGLDSSYSRSNPQAFAGRYDRISS